VRFRKRSLVIHVTFNSSAAGSLRQALGLRDRRKRVVDITDNLSWGPIGRGDFCERETWLDLNLPMDANFPAGGSNWDWIASGAKDFLNKLERSDEHLIWLAPRNADDLCGLHWYLDRFGGERASFVLVDHGLPGTSEGQAPRSIGELGPEQFRYLLDNASRTSWDEERFPRDRWVHLCNDATNLRIVHQGTAVSVMDDHFDEIILQQCSENWRRLYRVVGEGMIAIWETAHRTGDCFVMWRLRELHKQGKITSNRPITLYADRTEDPVLVHLA